MIEAGQFLTTTGSPYSLLSVKVIFAIILMVLALKLLHRPCVGLLCPEVNPHFFAWISISACSGVIITLIMTGAGREAFRWLALEPSYYYRAANFVHWGANKKGAIVIAIGVLLYVIGAGYAYSIVDAPFSTHLLSFSAGVGLPEEMAKAFTGLIIIWCYLSPKVPYNSEIRVHRASITAAFMIAGLGFGAGEAFKYFAQYAERGTTFEIYVIRALWCVSLHGAWSMIVGYLFCTRTEFKTVSDWWKDYTDLLLALVTVSIPSALMHGLYDALAVRNSVIMWYVGGASVVCAIFILAKLLWAGELEDPKQPSALAAESNETQPLGEPQSLGERPGESLREPPPGDNPPLSKLQDDLLSGHGSKDDLIQRYQLSICELNRHCQNLVQQGALSVEAYENLMKSKSSADASSVGMRTESSEKKSPEVARTVKKVKAKEILRDIDSGMDDHELMQKYELSAKQLVSLYEKLEQTGLRKKP